MAVYFISQRGIEGYRQELIFRTINCRVFSMTYGVEEIAL